MAPHSSTLAWKIPWMEEPGRLQSMGSVRVWQDWVTSLSLFPFMHWGRKWQPTPVFLPGESQGPGSLLGCRLGVAQSRTQLKQLSSSTGKHDRTTEPNWYISSVQFSHSVVSDSLWPHELRHARPPCPSPTAGVYPNSCPLHRPLGFPRWFSGKESACQAGWPASVCGLGRSLEKETVTLLSLLAWEIPWTEKPRGL